MIISNGTLYSIGASGLKAAETQIQVSSNNIANSDSVGFTRSDVILTERAVRAGVDAAAITRYDQAQEAIKNKIAMAVSADQTVTAAMNTLDMGAKSSGVANSWNNFVTSVYDFRQQGDPTAKKTLVDNYGSQLTSDYNNWFNSITELKSSTQIQQQKDQTQLAQLQIQLSAVSDDTTKAMIREQLSQLEGKITGQGDIVTKIIPSLELKANAAMDAAMAKVNVELGATAFTRATDGTTTYNRSAITGIKLINCTMTGDTMAKMISDILQHIGTTLSQQNNQNMNDSNIQQATNDAYKTAYGVDITTETLKIQRAQRMYEACAKCIQAEDANMKTLLAIM